MDCVALIAYASEVGMIMRGLIFVGVLALCAAGFFGLAAGGRGARLKRSIRARQRERRRARALEDRNDGLKNDLLAGARRLREQEAASQKRIKELEDACNVIGAELQSTEAEKQRAIASKTMFKSAYARAHRREEEARKENRRLHSIIDHIELE